VRAHNPLGRIPTLVLDDGEVLVDSAAIIDHLDEVYGRDHALTPPAGADRRAVLGVAALMMGACESCLPQPTSATIAGGEGASAVAR
jgi:glutathione S-transferase